MKSLLFKVCLLSLIVISYSCKKSSDSSSNPAPSFPAEWYSLKQNSNDTVLVQGGYLYLQTSYNAGNTSKTATSATTYGQISGDFEFTVNFSSFSPKGSKYASDVFAFLLVPSGGGIPVISGNLTDSMLYIMDNTLSSPTLKYTTNRQGTIYVKRIGANYTSWMCAGTDTVYLNKTNYSTAPLNLGFEIGSLDNTATHTSVHVQNFVIKGGGGVVVSDPFTKNTVTAL